MKVLILFCCIVMMFGTHLVFAEQLNLFTDSKVYSANKPLFVYGQALPHEDVILRIFSPDDTIVTFTQVTSDEKGKFDMELFVWPDASTSFPYGTYTVEAISTQQNGASKKIDRFLE